MTAPMALAELQRLYAANNFKAAKELCESFFAKRPDYCDVHMHPVYLKESLRIALAMDDMPAAMTFAADLQNRLRPDDPAVQVLFGRYYIECGNIAAAREQWEAALARKPGFKEAVEWSAVGYEKAARKLVVAAKPYPWFHGDELPLAASLTDFIRASLDDTTPDIGFLHAAESSGAAPSVGFLQGRCWFGPVTHRFQENFTNGRARMSAVRSISLGDAAYLPMYGSVFSPARNVYGPSAGNFVHSSDGAAALSYADPNYVVNDAGLLEVPNFDSLEIQPKIGIPVCGQGLPNYGHFLFDGLPLAFLIATELRGQAACIIGKPLGKWQLAILRALGIDDLYQAVERPTRFRRIVTSNLLYGHVPYPTRFARLVFDHIRLRLGVPANAGKQRIFVVRPVQSGRRHLINREETADCLTRWGFTLVQPELLSFEQQVRIFANASIVVGESGAAMANIGFCDPGTRVLEIMPEVHSEIWTRGVCLALSLEWHVYFAPVAVEAPPNAKGSERLDFQFRIDIASLDEALAYVCRE